MFHAKIFRETFFFTYVDDDKGDRKKSHNPEAYPLHSVLDNMLIFIFKIPKSISAVKSLEMPRNQLTVSNLPTIKSKYFHLSSPQCKPMHYRNIFIHTDIFHTYCKVLEGYSSSTKKDVAGVLYMVHRWINIS